MDRKLPVWNTEQRPRRDPRIFGLQMRAWVPWMKEAWSIFPNITIPILIITGDKEDPTGQSEKMAELIPDARCVVLRGLRPGSPDSGLNHFDGFMRSDVSVRYARPFLKRYAR